jgi:predicted permease
MTSSLSNDIRYGYRTLLANPGFSAVAILSLALGIGANTAIFSFLRTILMKDLPVREPERLALFGKGQARGIWGGAPEGPMDLYSWKQYRDFKARTAVFQDIIAEHSIPSLVYMVPGGESGAAPEPANATLVSGNYFQMLGVNAEAGRLFDASADEKPGANPLIVLSYGYWKRRYQADAAVIGRTLRIGDREYTITGIASRNFAGLDPGRPPDLWIPISMEAQLPGAFPVLDEPLTEFAYLIGRLKPGVSLAKAQSAMEILNQQVLQQALRESKQTSPGDAERVKKAHIVLTEAGKGFSGLRTRYGEPLQILMVTVALVLLIACANVANLLLGFAVKRRREIAVRIAMGAERGRIIRQLITESLLLSGTGGVLGMLAAAAIGRLLVALISTGPTPLSLGFEIDWFVLAFAIGVSFATGILFGIVPAIRASRVDVNTSLKEGKAGMALPKRVAFGRALVAGQVALSLALLVTAGLLLRSFRNLVTIDTGFNRQNVLLFKVDSEASGYKPDQRLANVYREIETRVSRLPGVAADGVSLFAFHEGQRSGSFQSPGVKLAENVRITTENFVSPGYFSALRIPILAGRGFSQTDSAASLPVVVVSESFARQIFGGQNVIGRTLQFDGEKKPVEIIGIAKDTKIDSVQNRGKDLKLVYHSVYQYPLYLHNIAVRITGNSSRVAQSVRQTIQAVDRNLPIRWTTTLADAVSDSLVRDRAIAQLTAGFAALALLLSAIGLYGTISFGVTRRTGEIGIRMALGAERVGVLGMVMRDALALTIAGIAIGLPLSLVAGRKLQSMLYGLSGFDPITIAISAATLALVAALAAYVPARRAARVDPMVALRYE